jgi:CBS domain-containing protein
LKEYAPFDQLTFQELSDIATSSVVNLEKTKRYSNLTMYCMIALFVASGVIHLSVIADAEETILNKCHEGAIFGLRPFRKKQL